jgi:beta-glucanase (GH16 family)
MKQILILAAIAIAFNATGQNDTGVDSILENFDDSKLIQFRYGSTGNPSEFKWRSGETSTTEPSAKVLSFRIDPSDSAGAGRGPEIISNQFTHFGTYSARLKVPDVKSVQPNVGAVVGYFTYHMDSVHGLSEIDFEWLIADPTVIYIGTWTGERGKLKRIGRIINMAKGIIYKTSYRVNHNGTDSIIEGQPTQIAPLQNYDASKAFYTYGFDWLPDRVTWWMLHPSTGDKIVLWDHNHSLGIPQHPSYYRMNFWHTNNWSVHTNPASLEKPAQPYLLEVDWMKYEKGKADAFPVIHK